MPLYEYECTTCGHRTELLQRHGDPPLDKCPECGGAVRKLFSAPAVQFKGTGWYVTDYGSKSKQPTAGKSAEGGDKKGKKSDKGEKGEKAGKSEKAERSSGESSSGGGKSETKSSGSKD